MQGRTYVFPWRTDFPPSPGHIILEADSIPYPVGQNFLGNVFPGHIGLADRFSCDTGTQ